MCCTIYVFLTTHGKENQWIYVFNLLSSFRGLIQGELQSVNRRLKPPIWTSLKVTWTTEQLHPHCYSLLPVYWTKSDVTSHDRWAQVMIKDCLLVMIPNKDLDQWRKKQNKTNKQTMKREIKFFIFFGR